jgi:two-component system, cell cycle response regulator DivK
MKPEMRPLVLLVDDNLDTLEALAFCLRTAGFGVETATNGRQAEERARVAMPDVIVMDLAMPDLDGWEATHRIKSNEATRNVPVIACTGHAFLEAREAARQAGCDSYLTKPVEPALLVSEIHRVLELARQTKALASPPYELLLFMNLADSSSMRGVLERLRGEFDPSLVDIAVRGVTPASPGSAADSIGQEPELFLRRAGAPLVRVNCEVADLESLVQRLREAGLPRRKVD